MNHKRKRPKNRRAGCLLCKPHKMNHAKHKGLKDKEYQKEKMWKIDNMLEPHLWESEEK